MYEQPQHSRAAAIAATPPASAPPGCARLGLVGSGHHSWDSRGHFFATAAEAMRHILVDRARRKRRAKHGGEFQRLDIDVVEIAAIRQGAQEFVTSELPGKPLFRVTEIRVTALPLAE